MRNPNGPLTGRPTIRAKKGMIATSHYLASTTGLRILRNGGSAVDAAISANAVLCVVYPHMAGLGGDGFWLIHDPKEGLHALNASGPSAQKATIEYYNENGFTEEIPERGAFAALTVPGAVDGWRMAHERFGKLEWNELFEDAINYAADGVAVSRSVADKISEVISVLNDQPSSGRLFMPEGNVLREGNLLRQNNLAQSFRNIAKNGSRDGFYKGRIAKQLCEFVEQGGSPLRVDDFAEYEAEWVDPISTTYRGYKAVEFPPNTQGFTVLQILNMIEHYDVSAWGDGTVDYYHHLAEAVKLAFADRDAWLSDPKFTDIPLDHLISKEYANKRREKINQFSSMEMDSVEPGMTSKALSGAMSSGGDTCYFSVVDQWGQTASVIQSIYHEFGSAVIGGDTGILLQNRGAGFKLDEDHPNALEPGKRAFHTLIPAMLLQDDKPYLSYGTMGGEGQPQTHVALVTRLIDFKYDIQQAIEAPRWLMGRTWGVKTQDLSLEGRISDEVARELKFRGQPVKILADWDDNMGHAQAIRIDRENGFLEGGADPRGDGVALGY